MLVLQTVSLKNNYSSRKIDEEKSNLEEIPKRNDQTCRNEISLEDLFTNMNILEKTIEPECSASNKDILVDSEANSSNDGSTSGIDFDTDSPSSKINLASDSSSSGIDFGIDSSSSMINFNVDSPDKEINFPANSSTSGVDFDTDSSRSMINFAADSPTNGVDLDADSSNNKITFAVNSPTSVVDFDAYWSTSEIVRLIKKSMLLYLHTSVIISSR